MSERLNIIQSYVRIRNLLGLTNSGKNQTLGLSFEITETEFFVKNAVSQKKLLLLSRSRRLGRWIMSATYPEAVDFAEFILKNMTGTDLTNTNLAFDELEKLLGYKD